MNFLDRVLWNSIIILNLKTFDIEHFKVPYGLVFAGLVGVFKSENMFAFIIFLDMCA